MDSELSPKVVERAPAAKNMIQLELQPFKHLNKKLCIVRFFQPLYHFSRYNDFELISQSENFEYSYKIWCDSVSVHFSFASASG